MITYLNSRNAQQYYVLFDKATKLLREYGDEQFKQAIESDNNYNRYNLTTDTEVDESKIYYIYNIEDNEYTIVENPVDEDIATYYEASAGADFTISSLNEYFAYLNDILDAVAKKDHGNTNEANDKAFFVRLPLDEDVFAINANTRVITVPAAFEANGISVQGDELAEVVYFTIDRFFDKVDLANDAIQIAIQWEYNGTKGFSRNFGKDIETIPGKIIFGWPISHELTHTPGTIRFAVRFYSVNTNEETHAKEIAYSLATLPATVKIAATIDHNLIDDTMEGLNYGDKITARVLNSGIYDMSIEPPKLPLITLPLQVLNNEDYDSTDTIVDLQDGGIKLGVGAVPDGAGVISYQWKMYPYNDAGGYDSSNAILLNSVNQNDVKNEFIEVKEELSNNDIYYDENRNVVSISNLSLSRTYTEDQGYQIGDTENYIKLFRSVSTAKALDAGQYKVDITSRIRVNSVTKQEERVITIPGPQMPVVALPEDEQAHMILENDNLNIIADVSKGNELGRSDKVELTKEWYRYDETLENWLKVNEEPDLEEEETAESYVSINGEQELVLTVQDLINTETKAGDQYRIKAIATRNGKTATGYSGIYRITRAPQAPIVSILKGNEWVLPQVYGYPENAYYPTNASEMTLSFGINKEIFSDKLTCLWVKAPMESNEELPYLSTEGLSESNANLVEKINLILNTNPSLIGYPDPIMEIQTNPVLTNDKYVTSKTFSKDANEVDIQIYCVIVNELNNNIAVTVTPYLRLATR